MKKRIKGCVLEACPSLFFLSKGCPTASNSLASRWESGVGLMASGKPVVRIMAGFWHHQKVRILWLVCLPSEWGQQRSQKLERFLVGLASGLCLFSFTLWLHFGLNIQLGYIMSYSSFSKLGHALHETGAVLGPYRHIIDWYKTFQAVS